MSSPALSFSILHACKSSAARIGRVRTPHGEFDTPAFMPVGTRASVKGLLPELVRHTGAQIILNNAYHLMLRPGDELIAALGGAHRFMNWSGPILTDSGGFQAFSMADINAIDEDGVTFQSIIDGARIRLTPEKSIHVQNNLGADIIMAFDDCPPAHRGEHADPLHRDRLLAANDRTVRWLQRCIRAHRRTADQALFGIVQGGVDLDLRAQSARSICAFDLPGFAIGGVAVGESPQAIHSVVAHTAPLLPSQKPRYLMGVGYEIDIVNAVRAGVDMFDCVLPTRNGRNGNVFTRRGPLHLRNAVHRDDPQPIDPHCSCLVCKDAYSRAYLRHLFHAGEMLGPVLASIHNLHHFQSLVLDIRRAIRDDAWPSFWAAWPVLASAATDSSPSMLPAGPDGS